MVKFFKEYCSNIWGQLKYKPTQSYRCVAVIKIIVYIFVWFRYLDMFNVVEWTKIPHHTLFYNRKYAWGESLLLFYNWGPTFENRKSTPYILKCKIKSQIQSNFKIKCQNLKGEGEGGCNKKIKLMFSYMLYFSE